MGRNDATLIRMQRRHLFVLGAATATALGLAGMSAAWMRPPRVQGRLSAPARHLMAVVARAVLDEALPAEAAAREAALQGHLQRLEGTLQGLTFPLQAEVDQLLALLAAPPGRLALLQLTTPWPAATTGEVQVALQGLRSSSLALRQQIFHALRDLTAAAYFADASTWPALGYPGPRAV